MLGGLVGKGYLGGGPGWEGIFGLGGLVGREFSAGGLVAGGPGCGGPEWNTDPTPVRDHLFQNVTTHC